MGKNLNFEIPDDEVYWQWKRQKDEEDATWFEFFKQNVEGGWGR